MKPLTSLSNAFALNKSKKQLSKQPAWLKAKISRRKALKAAAGVNALLAFPSFTNPLPEKQVSELLQTDPWLTLDAVLAHLLPSSPSGPGAKEIQATMYLMNVVNLQPTEQAEIDFIYKGVGWLNGYTQSQLKENFVALNVEDKESMLRAISKSQAGENWLNNLIGYIYEAMLTPPIYGGNPNGIGWQWLEHKPGYPLPTEGGRYYELPGQIPITFIPTNESNLRHDSRSPQRRSVKA